MIASLRKLPNRWRWREIQNGTMSSFIFKSTNTFNYAVSVACIVSILYSDSSKWYFTKFMRHSLSFIQLCNAESSIKTPFSAPLQIIRNNWYINLLHNLLRRAQKAVTLQKKCSRFKNSWLSRCKTVEAKKLVQYKRSKVKHEASMDIRSRLTTDRQEWGYYFCASNTWKKGLVFENHIGAHLESDISTERLFQPVNTAGYERRIAINT